LPRIGISNFRGKSRAGLLKTEKTFRQAADQFTKEYGIITEGQRSERWVEGHKIRLRLHLVPFFGELGVSEVTAGKVQEYRVHRATTPPVGGMQPIKMTKGETPAYKPPSRSTLHDEVVTLRLVLKTAIRHAWLGHLPDLSPPYRTQGNIVHRPWFSPDEYKQLYQATREYARTARADHRWEAEQLHDYVLFLGNTGLRPDEARNLDIETFRSKRKTARRFCISRYAASAASAIARACRARCCPISACATGRSPGYRKPGGRAGGVARISRKTSPPRNLHILNRRRRFSPATIKKCSTTSWSGRSSSSIATASRARRIACATPISACA
jgi:integrase